MKEIKAKEGYWLTLVSIEDEASRTFACTIFTPNTSIWKEVDNKFKENWEKEHPAPEPPTIEDN